MFPSSGFSDDKHFASILPLIASSVVLLARDGLEYFKAHLRHHIILPINISVLCWVLVAHAYNPSYSRRQRSGGLQFNASLGK
jgi:hypothetical protein